MIFDGFMIAGTSFTTSKKMKISVTWEKRTRDFSEEELITFSDEDAVGITLPHNDMLVITMLIGNCRLKRKVVEEKSLLEKIIPVTRTLAGFNKSSETTKGEIELPVEARGITKVTKFYIIDGDIQYNAIFGRPWLHDIKSVPSTLHLLLKFPTPNGIKHIRGEKSASKEMFAIKEPAAIQSPSVPDE
ncbi:uncharacterized protein LOC132613681 [Lycium barbarum]|uniref:uncharacterized protein LOC132613681 n=1 Tax=Lycium barbarum TaxID=112863 RepID=UPI00293F4D63|nr:uncharacterized protein LOC132613681 [Lycium barbarum]